MDLQHLDAIHDGLLLGLDLLQDGGDLFLQDGQLGHGDAEGISGPLLHVGHGAGDAHGHGGQTILVMGSTTERGADGVHAAGTGGGTDGENGFLVVFAAHQGQSLGTILLHSLDVLQLQSGGDDDGVACDDDFCHSYVLLFVLMYPI